MTEKEFLTFVLGSETYALDIHRVQEIKGYQTPTPIANAPNFIKGVINLRGEIVPIVDLRIKFAVGTATYDEFTIVIMLHIEGRIIGIVVDEVSDVIIVQPDDIKSPPEFGVAFEHEYLEGLTDVNSTMTIIVNIDKLMTSKELGVFTEYQALSKDAGK